MNAQDVTTLRVAKSDGSWLELECRVEERDPDGRWVQVFVPAWGTWLLTPTKMQANIGGNDWRIYDVHPDDCARLARGMT